MAPSRRLPARVMPASVQPTSATRPMHSGMAITSSRAVGIHCLRPAMRSMRRPVPKRPMTTHSSLTISQGCGRATGSIAAGIPGIQTKAAKPLTIRSAEVAGSRPETNRGNQKDRMMLMPSAASRM